MNITELRIYRRWKVGTDPNTCLFWNQPRFNDKFVFNTYNFCDVVPFSNLQGTESSIKEKHVNINISELPLYILLLYHYNMRYTIMLLLGVDS